MMTLSELRETEVARQASSGAFALVLQGISCERFMSNAHVTTKSENFAPWNPMEHVNVRGYDS